MTRPHPYLTLLAAVLVMGAGVLLGVRMLTSAGEAQVAAPTCTDRAVATGEPLTPNLVQVNVLNASGREGQANRVTINLQRRGFLEGAIANSTSAVEVPNVTILTSDPEDPRVQLVAQQFVGEIAYAEPDIPVEDGVTVIIGDGYQDLNPEAPTEIVSTRDLAICVPIIDL
ncbi:hypothetical protein HMPREF0063_12872 [Aeromicrobium marinum DSM 15272]|uniref:LytR/CpsA/Psr regulator C-terminal domain-containing protein n=1 Tax=Aeromicrobium marinum DSM 15272 TaxID=585531 RepID=E2SFR3_9ACTN|nr:LytR C-terminal domain-containing protein [Aeromicrobium marinum]EFQ81965.1 hypothetical protein HMPREF0063_12872 [Aeromicrobium marinum DSM 15272]